jgi:hypothetical protein
MKKFFLITLVVVAALFGAGHVVTVDQDYKQSADPGGGVRPKG